MSFKGMLMKAGIYSTGEDVTIGAGEYGGQLNVTKSSPDTTGTIRGGLWALTMTGAATANMVEGLNVTVTSDVKTGAWCNAITGKIDYSDTGAAHGMAAAICAEMIPPDGSLSRGALYALDCEFGCGSSSTWGSAGPVAFMKFENWGTADHFSANAFLFHLKGETGAAGALLSENSRTLKVRIGTTTKYLYLSDTEDDLGAAVFDTMVLDPGRIATGSLAGTAATLGATYAYGSGMYLRYDVTDWTGKGTEFVGMYLRAEATTVTAAGKSVYGTQIYGSTQQTMTTGQLNGALIYAYKKGSVTATINKMYAVQAELTWDADCGTTTLTTEAAIILAKVTGGTLASYTQLHGMIIRVGDMNGGSRTYGTGIKIEDDAGMGGTCTLTTGIDIAIGCVTAINVSTAGRVMIGAQGSSTPGDGLPVTSTYPHLVEVHTCPVVDLDDYTSSFGFRSRYEVSTDQTGAPLTIHAIDGRLRLKSNLANGVYAGVAGTVEGSSTLTYAGTTGFLCGGLFTIDMDNTMTLSSGYLLGVGINSAVAGDEDVSSVSFIGLRIWTGSNKEPWTYGISMEGAIGDATGRAIRSVTTQDVANHGDGYGANEFDLSITGTTAGDSACMSAWVNVASGTVTSGRYISAISTGIYQVTAEVVGTILITGLRISGQIADTDFSRLAPFALNHTQNISALFVVADKLKNGITIGSSGGVSAQAGSMRMAIDSNGTVYYVKLYSDVAS